MQAWGRMAVMITAFASVKGGTGKSTVLVNMAAERARLGRSVLVVDADPIVSSVGWVVSREERNPDLLPIYGAVRSGDLARTLRDFNQASKHVPAAVGGRDTREWRSAPKTVHV